MHKECNYFAQKANAGCLPLLFLHSKLNNRNLIDWLAILAHYFSYYYTMLSACNGECSIDISSLSYLSSRPLSDSDNTKPLNLLNASNSMDAAIGTEYNFEI